MKCEQIHEHKPSTSLLHAYTKHNQIHLFSGPNTLQHLKELTKTLQIKGNGELIKNKTNTQTTDRPE